MNVRLILRFPVRIYVHCLLEVHIKEVGYHELNIDLFVSFRFSLPYAYNWRTNISMRAAPALIVTEVSINSNIMQKICPLMIFSIRILLKILLSMYFRSNYQLTYI